VTKTKYPFLLYAAERIERTLWWSNVVKVFRKNWGSLFDCATRVATCNIL